MPSGLRPTSRIKECSVFYLSPEHIPSNLNVLRSNLEMMRAPLSLPDDQDEIAGFSPPFYLTMDDVTSEGEGEGGGSASKDSDSDYFTAPLLQESASWLVFQFTYMCRKINESRRDRMIKFEIRKKVEELDRSLTEEEVAAVTTAAHEKARAIADIQYKSFPCVLDTHTGILAIGYSSSNPKKPNAIIKSCVVSLANAFGYAPVRVIHRENTTTLTAWLAEPLMHLPEHIDIHTSARLKNKKTEAQAALTNQNMDTPEIDELLKHSKVVEEIGMELVNRGYCTITKYGDLKKIRENAVGATEGDDPEEMPADEFWNVEMIEQLTLVYAMINEIVFLHTPTDLDCYSNPSAEFALDQLSNAVKDEESSDIDSEEPVVEKKKTSGAMKKASKRPPMDEDEPSAESGGGATELESDLDLSDEDGSSSSDIDLESEIEI